MTTNDTKTISATFNDFKHMLIAGQLDHKSHPILNEMREEIFKKRILKESLEASGFRINDEFVINPSAIAREPMDEK